jgi:hypothetical protein
VVTNQDVIIFPMSEREVDRQLQASLLVGDIAERLYHARALYLGGGLLPWGCLSQGQREQYRAEVERLIKEAL